MGTVRVATYNMENLFRRPRVMNAADWDEGRPALEAITRLNDLLAKEVYDEDDRREIAGILIRYEVDSPDPERQLFRIDQIRQKLYVVRRGGDLEVVAKGRGDWVGWVELVAEELAPEVVTNTGRVVDAVMPDVLLCVEVENRPALQRFNDQILAEWFPRAAFPYNMVIDGNDPRGIDLGLLSRFPIEEVRPHVFDAVDGRPVFSRDCPEYRIALPGGGDLWILGNHFKSKGYGSPQQSAGRRLRQAERVKEIYAQVAERSPYVIVAGDLNDTPGSPPLRALVEGTGLRDAMDHPTYDGRPGTYGTGNTPSSKIDYLMLSPALWATVGEVEVERRGVYTRDGERFDTVTGKANQASDHAALYADLVL